MSVRCEGQRVISRWSPGIARAAPPHLTHSKSQPPPLGNRVGTSQKFSGLVTQSLSAPPPLPLLSIGENSASLHCMSGGQTKAISHHSQPDEAGAAGRRQAICGNTYVGTVCAACTPPATTPAGASASAFAASWASHRSASPDTPVSTNSVSIPYEPPNAMSVSKRSPTIRLRDGSMPWAFCSKDAKMGEGLPQTIGALAPGAPATNASTCTKEGREDLHTAHCMRS